jgi:hypothetical protein
MRVFGCDPGKIGGWAVLEDGKLLDAMMMPTMTVKGKDCVDSAVLHDWVYSHASGDCMFVIEAVHAMPRQGVSSSFQFGRMFGAVEAAAISTGYRVEHVSPASWKRKFQLDRDKQSSIDAARLRFGSELDKYVYLKKHEGVAEACLLAAYGHEMYN